MQADKRSYMMFMRIKKVLYETVVRDTRFPLQDKYRYKKKNNKVVYFTQSIMRGCGEYTSKNLETHFHGTGYQYRQSFCEERSTTVNMMIFSSGSSSGRSGYCMGDISWAYVNAIRVSDFAWMQYEGYVKQTQCEMMNY